jgi:hypothetical protein
MILNTKPNIARPDDFYEALIEAHRDLTEAQSLKVNTRLILLLANHVGDMDALTEALALARMGVEPEATAETTQADAA